MLHILFPVLLSVSLLSPQRPADSSSLEVLKQEIRTELSKYPGTFAVAFRDMATGTELLLNEHEIFHAASTLKTAVMIEAFKQAAEGRFSMADSVEIKNSFSSIADGSAYSLDPGSDGDQEIYRLIGKKLTVADLVYRMIIRSSNLATNLMIEMVGARHANQTIRTYGVRDMQVLRGVEDGKAYQKGMNNTTTAFDLMRIFQHMADGKIIRSADCESMIRILMDQEFNEIIPARLPAQVKVAHKTGSITGVRHDSGIVFLPDGRKYVLVLLSNGLQDEDAGVKAMARVSERIYDYMMKKRT
ncbi:MAG TPA: serine hydrolase [Sphingobacteriaceae bacterium]